MAESFLAIVADKVLGQIVSLIGQENGMGGYWGLKDNLRKLQNTVNNVKAVILDAEEAQLTSHEVCTWLSQLKHVLLDAEDVFDEFSYESTRKQLVINKKVRSFLSMSSNPVSFRLRMSRKVREVREAFDEVAANRAKFHLNTHHMMLVPNNSGTLLLNQRELTHSFVNASQIIGRDGDRGAILGSLMSLNARVSVVSIVGIGGMGKTALAKMVFNDPIVVGHFEKRVWVCLGNVNEFNVNRVMIQLVKSITGERIDTSDPERSQSCLRDSLRDKRFLLVLDDVWDVDRSKWLEFKELLMCGANGSKVVVTTRYSSVALNTGSALAHGLEGLPHPESVSLFKKFAFSEGEDDQNLMKIGDVIVGKCKGVPLAIKTLGCLLFSKHNTVDWVFVRDNEIWQLEQKKDDILPALKISYNQLSFTLKQCFLYCAVFPKDQEFDDFELITHWSSYGLIRSDVKGKKVEDIGQQCIYELLDRGFFQDFVEFPTFSKFKMHDLFHDLALSVTQSELKSMKADRQGNKATYKSIRHVAFSRRDSLGGEVVPNLFPTKNSTSSCVMPSVWAVIFDEIEERDDGIAQLLEICISKLKHLRIMYLPGTSSLERLPSSIGDLKHLRYLSLDRCSSLKRLPVSICRLHNLQTLSLFGCYQLEELPKNIGDLVNLSDLEITTKQKRLSKQVGDGIESLSSLQHLTLDSCENLKYIFEAETNGDDDHGQQLLLTSLHRLRIYNCRSLTCLSPSNPITKNPREISELETLVISGCLNVNLDSIFNDQIRLVKLRCLVLADLLQMESLPEWIGDEGCATTLELLTIRYCPNLTSLPEWLYKLTSLRRLRIHSCPALLCIPEGLSALKDLEIHGCPELSRRCIREIGEDWLQLKHIPKIKLNGQYQ